MSEGKGLTLRKKGNKRAQISGPQPAANGLPTRPNQKTGGPSALSVPKTGPSETSDLVKRRYSTRFNQLPDFSANAPPVPGLPPGHIQRSSRSASPRRPATNGRTEPLHVDAKVLSDPNLEHERYVTSLLSNATEEDIQEYQNDLRKIKHRTSIDLQRNVYQNRTQFIKISKEAEKLKNEMGVLQGLMSELTGALGHTNVNNTNGYQDTGMDLASRKRANRSSVANLEAMWNVQLQSLWKNIEKSQKFLPAIPGRHIVMETGHWTELDSATWKAKRPVHIVILNDHLLVASKKRKRLDPNAPQKGPAPTKLVAEECWPLQGIDLVDLAANVATGAANGAQDDRIVVSAFTVRFGGKSFTYRHERRDENAKNKLLFTFKKAVEDLRKSAKAENEKSSPQNDSLSYFASRDPASAKKPEIMESINSSRDKPEILIEVDGKQQNLRWVEGQIDDLDIDIALQRFETAVGKVEKLRNMAEGLKGNSIAQDLILVKLDERASKLADVLVRELIDTPAFLETTKTKTTYLTRLGFEDRAREAYLGARTDTLVKRSRQCIFEGDLHKYIFQISYVYFTIVKNTVLIYQACFAPVMMSASIVWAKGHLETFNTLLVRQLSSVDRNGAVWRECMDLVWTHEREMLGDIGLDFGEVIGRGLEVRAVKISKDTTSQDASRSKSRTRPTA
jgi:exocyst complex component 8